MGCGASVAPVATPEQKVEMMSMALKEMMIHVGTTAISNGEKVAVKSPLEHVGKIRESVDKIKKAAAASKEALSGGDGKAAAAAAKVPGAGAMGGMMGGFAAKAGAMVDQGLDVAGAAAGSAAETVLNGLATAIETGIDKLDGEFAKVGQEVAKAHVDDIIAAFKTAINDRKISDPQTYIRGAVPHGREQAAACAKDAVSQDITDNTKTELIAKMSEVCKKEVQDCTACKSWKALIDSYNKANETIGTLGEKAKQFQQEPITLDIEQYIVEQVVLGYHALMAEQEAASRAAPNMVTVPNHATTFVLCWDVSDNGVAYDAIMGTHYNDFKYKES